MKIHLAEVCNWRQHSKTRIDFDENVTVIYGPNEVGKSAILEALSRGLFDKSSSQAEAIARVKPLTALGNITSTVRIEFSLKKKRYFVEKNFNARRGTSLYKVVDKKKVLLYEDNEADEHLIKLLEADLPSSRGSKPSQWGAFHWLWAPQDYRELPSPKEGDPTKSLHLETKDGGSVLVTPRFQMVQEAIQSSYAIYFTKTGRNTSNSPISDFENKIQNLNEKSSELNDKIKNVEEEKQKLESLQEQLTELEQKLEDTKKELERARKEGVDISSIESELKVSKSGLNGAEREVEDARKVLEELNSIAKTIEQLQRKEKENTGKLATLEALCAQLEKQQKVMKEDVEKKAMKIRECEELLKDARILWTKVDTEEKMKELKNKMKRISDIENKIKTLRKKQTSNAPTKEEIEDIVKKQIRIETLKENLASSGLTVRVSPGRAGSLKVSVDGGSIKEGRTTTTGVESVCVEAPNFGKVLIKAKLEKARDAKIDIENLNKKIEDIFDKYHVKSIDELKKLDQIQTGITKRTEGLLSERKGIDKRPTDEINIELCKLVEKYKDCEKYKRTALVKKSNPIDTDLGKLMKKREKEEKEARKLLDEMRGKRDKADTELSKEKERLATARAENRHISEELNTAKDRERELIRKYGSVENQKNILEKAKIRFKKCKEEYNKINKKYEELERGPINRRTRLEQQEQNQDKLITQHRSSIDHIKGWVEKASLDGSYSELTDMQSTTENFQERLNKEKIIAESLKLLKETLEQQYRSALSTVVGPIQEEVRCSLGYVTGFLHENVELNEYLFPVKLGERGFEDIKLEFDDGSSGLKEVLTLCVRLAVAKHLCGTDSQCLVLDDPFVHVSSDRSNKMIELLNEAIKEYGLQVIIFTHRPAEFAGLSGKMIDIQSVK